MVKKSDVKNEETIKKENLPRGAPQPFVTADTENKNKTSPAALHPELPRRLMEIPGGPKRSDHMMSINNDANTLKVGGNISLNGKIIACEKLVVEGNVEATLNDAKVIEVCEGGFFKGNAGVEAASISGKFVGTLIAKDVLTIHKGGHVEGSIRYGKIIIEAGGEITGDMSSLEIENKPSAHQDSSTD